MLMLTMRECFGQKERPGVMKPQAMDVRDRGFVTRLPLAEALGRIRAYETAYKARYDRVGLWIEFELLQVSSIEDLDDEAIEISRAVHVEKLDESIDQMNKRLDG